MSLLKSFIEGLSVIIMLINNNHYQVTKEDKFISTKAIVKNLDYSSGSIKKVISVLVKGKVLTSVPGPKGGIKPNRNLKKIPVAFIFTLFYHEDSKYNSMVNYINDSAGAYPDPQSLNVFKNNLLQAFGDASNRFADQLNHYKVKDLLKAKK